MVVKHSPRGLIATTRVEATPPLAEVAECCGWPLLLEASPRRMHRELALHDLECVLFWLDDRLALAATAHLIAWLRHHGARPYRVAVACCMTEDVESVLRTAGAHSFLSMSGQSGTLVAAALERLLHESVRTADATTITAFAPSAAGETATLEFPAEPARPP